MYRIIKVDLRTGEQLRWPSPVASERFGTEDEALRHMRNVASLSESQWMDESTLSLMTEGAPWKYTVAVVDEPAQVLPRAIRFPKGMLEDIKRSAKKRGISVNAYVVKAVQEELSAEQRELED